MHKSLLVFITIFLISTPFYTIAATSTNTTSNDGSSVLNALIPSKKNCNYVDKKLYQPFSDIGSNFPAIGSLIVKGKSGDDCVNVAGGATENLLQVFFVTAISIIIVLTVINIAVSGIQYMTEQATGKIGGGAKKRLTDSFIALALGLLSYTILYTVNKQLVNFTFNPASLDTDGSIDKGIQDAISAARQAEFSTAWNNIEIVTPPTDYLSPNNPYQPSFGEVTTSGNFSTLASFGSIRCSGVRCLSSKPTVFGYLDGDGTVGLTGDNGIGNASWSTKPGCTYDTGNTITMGVALPQGFWRATGIPFSEVKYLGIKIIVNGAVRGIMPVVDDSQSNLDFTFAAARAFIDPTIVNSNSLNTSGKKVEFEIIRDYFKTNPKNNIVWTSNKSTFTNKIPCTI